jgi:RNA polymerase sigma-70 factor (ECF subfamily)
VHAALARLSPNERWVLGLAYYADLSHREICAQTALPLGTVKSLILRAQAKLREQLADH